MREGKKKMDEMNKEGFCVLTRYDVNEIEKKVNHPEHYLGKKYEVIDIIEDFGLGFGLGNAIKYILRAGRKGEQAEDLRKAIWYLEREYEKCKRGDQGG